MRRENKHKLIQFFLLALFLSYYGSITFFSHFHVINGVTIVHSHFFPDASSPAQEPGHSHSAKEITLISHLGTFVTLVMTALVVTTPYRIYKKHHEFPPQATTPDRQVFTLRFPRAPPVLV